MALTALRRFMETSLLKDSPGIFRACATRMAKALFVLKYRLRFDLIAAGYVRGARRRWFDHSTRRLAQASPSEARRDLMARWTETRSAPGFVPIIVAASFEVSSRSFNNSIAFC
jgi:hypothetical protein